jgi:hypothetical protein
VVDLAFDTFSRLGTLNGVLRYFADHQIQLPVRARTGPAKGELEWRRPTRETLQIMLHNPIYTGYYAYRRRGSTRARSSRAGPAPGGSSGPAANGWYCCPAGCPPTSPWNGMRRMW